MADYMQITALMSFYHIKINDRNSITRKISCGLGTLNFSKPRTDVCKTSGVATL